MKGKEVKDKKKGKRIVQSYIEISYIFWDDDCINSSGLCMKQNAFNNNLIPQAISEAKQKDQAQHDNTFPKIKQH